LKVSRDAVSRAPSPAARVLVVRGCTRGRLLECSSTPSRSSVGAYIPLLYTGEGVFEYRHLYRRRRRLLERFPPLSPFLAVLRLAFLSFPLSFPSCSPFFLLSFPSCSPSYSPSCSPLASFLPPFFFPYLAPLRATPTTHPPSPLPTLSFLLIPPHSLILACLMPATLSFLLTPPHALILACLILAMPSFLLVPPSFLLVPPHALILAHTSPRSPLVPRASAPPRIPQTM
jgi:hypothetical protein